MSVSVLAPSDVLAVVRVLGVVAAVLSGKIHVYPPETTAERFPFVAIRILAGKVCTHVPKRPARIRRGLIFGDGCGPW